MNVRGLFSNTNKRSDVFNWVKAKKISIVCFQVPSVDSDNTWTLANDSTWTSKLTQGDYTVTVNLSGDRNGVNAVKLSPAVAAILNFISGGKCFKTLLL
jgi:hypothetical protein